jgi:hypothetical protein
MVEFEFTQTLQSEAPLVLEALEAEFIRDSPAAKQATRERRRDEERD